MSFPRGLIFVSCQRLVEHQLSSGVLEEPPPLRPSNVAVVYCGAWCRLSNINQRHFAALIESLFRCERIGSREAGYRTYHHSSTHHHHSSSSALILLICFNLRCSGKLWTVDGRYEFDFYHILSHSVYMHLQLHCDFVHFFQWDKIKEVSRWCEFANIFPNPGL